MAGSRYTILTLLFGVAITFSSFGQHKKSDVEKRQNEIKAEYLMIKGMSKFLLEDYDDALSKFKEAHHFSPDNAAINYKIGETYFLQGVKSQATLYAKEAIRLDPKNVYYYELLANIHKSELRPEKAAETYEALLKNISRQTDYHYDLAEIYSDLGREQYQLKMQLSVNSSEKKGKRNKKLKQAEERMTMYFNKVLKSMNALEKKHGISEELVTNKQLIYLRLNKPDEAYKEGERLIKAFPDEPIYKVYQAELLMSNNENSRAMQLLQTAIMENPDYGNAHLMLHELYKKEDENERAVEHLEIAFNDREVKLKDKVVRLQDYFLAFEEGDNKEIAEMLTDILVDVHADDPLAHSLKGDLHNSLNQQQEARDSYLKSLRLDNSSYQIWQKVVIFDLDLNEKDSLLKHSEEALEIFPNQPILWLYNGMGHSLNKDYKKAVSSMEQGKKLAGEDQQLANTFNSQLGDMYNDTKEYDKSDAAYEAVLAQNPDDPHVLNNFSYFLSLRGEKLDLAKEMSQRLVDEYPDDPTYLDTYAWVLYMLGEYDKSKLYLEKALQESKDGTIIEHYGDVLFKLGKTDKAVEEWKRAKENGGTSEFIDRKISEKKIITE